VIYGSILLAIAAVAIAGRRAGAFNPQPDPPAFGAVFINPDETLRLSVGCYEHPVGTFLPGPCRGELMIHDAAGNVVASRTYRLIPGEIAFLDFTLSVRVVGDAVGSLGGFIPCVLPGPDSGRAVPSVQVFDTVSGRTSFVLGPAAVRISEIKIDGRP